MHAVPFDSCHYGPLVFRCSADQLGADSVRCPTFVGEWFPVKRKLLRPCIALTKAVRSEDEAEVDVSVDVETDIFDRQACDVKELLSRPVHPPTLAGGPTGACGRM